MNEKFVDKEFVALHRFDNLEDFKEWAEALLNYDKSSPLYNKDNAIKVITGLFPKLHAVDPTFQLLDPNVLLGTLGLEAVLVTHDHFDWKIVKKEDEMEWNENWEFEIL